MKISKILAVILLVAVLMLFTTFAVFAAPTWGGQNQSQSTSIYEGMFSYRVGRDGTVTVTKGLPAASGAVVIPAEIDGALVTSIGDYAFQHCVKITSIELPSTITNIGYSAFYGCLLLESINIPDSVTKIEYGAFYNCKALKKAEIADLASWCKASLDGPYANPAHIIGTLTVNGK
ncbi:MAG: leucine-rich repeat domain-containing protein, partial [Clostridia bacterium]|nr:leucine-rich repeat domain-containing protein [Clostridia bacterium]